MFVVVTIASDRFGFAWCLVDVAVGVAFPGFPCSCVLVVASGTDVIYAEVEDVSYDVDVAAVFEGVSMEGVIAVGTSLVRP